MQETGRHFADRMQFEAAGVRGTIFPGRALILDAAAEAPVPVTGVRPGDGESYGGDRIAFVPVTAGTTCVALDAAGQGCTPPPVGSVGPGATSPLVALTCDASSGGI